MKKGLLLFLLVMSANAMEIGIVEKVNIYTPSGTHEVAATVDTGADSSSIDAELAKSMGLVANDDTIIITDARGKERRYTIDLQFAIGDKEVHTVGTISNRSELSTKMLIGAKDLEGFIVNPSETYLSIPKNTAEGRIASVLSHVLERDYIRLILIIPILSIVILFLRHIIGLQTYGIFGPLIVAVSIYQVGFLQGLMMFFALLVVGLAVKFVLARYSLPLITELSIIMFFLAATTVMLTVFMSSTVLMRAVFPMIITSFIVERFSQQLEIHETKQAFMNMLTTVCTSLLLALLISLIMMLNQSMLMLLFVSSLLASIILGNYVGLRLTEVFRFKLLGGK